MCELDEKDLYKTSLEVMSVQMIASHTISSTTVCGDGGCGICGGSGPLLGFLSCSPHCRPEEQEDDVLEKPI